MKKITKAVIPVAGFGTRFIPFTKSMPKEMLPIIDTPTIQYIVEEAVQSGITDILFITSSHANKRAIEDHFDSSKSLELQLKEKNNFKAIETINNISTLANVHYIRQHEAKGLGHAINCAKTFVGNEPFAILLGDDIVVNETPAIKQLIDAYYLTGYSQIGVQEVDMAEVNKYGIIKSIDNKSISKMIDFVEKPNISDAPSNKAVLGRYVLSPTIFTYLENQTVGTGHEIQLTDSIKRMMENEDVFSCTFEGQRYDIGDKLGYLKAIFDFALANDTFSADLIKHIKSKL